MNARLFFHYVSYLQYPLMIVGMYFCVRPFFGSMDNFLVDYNKCLIFLGIALSFSCLQDTQKTQNNFSKKIWQDPKKGRRFLFLMAFLTIAILVFGLIEYFKVNDSQLKEMSFGFIVLGIGMLGMLKSAIEMFENHRLDKNPPT